jgi:hypothetical protein
LQAYKRGLYGHRVVWIITGWFDSDWWTHDNPNINCTKEQMAEVAEGYFDAGIVYINPQ